MIYKYTFMPICVYMYIQNLPKPQTHHPVQCTAAHTRTYIYNTHICIYHLHNPLNQVTPRTLCNTLPHTHAYMHIHVYHTHIYILIYTTCLTPWIVHTQYPPQYTPVHTRTPVYRYILHTYIFICMPSAQPRVEPHHTTNPLQ